MEKLGNEGIPPPTPKSQLNCNPISDIIHSVHRPHVGPPWFQESLCWEWLMSITALLILSWTLSPVKSWVPLCSILIDVWSGFISELTFWLQSSQALCLKSLKFGMRIFYNCTDLVSHISILLTISDSICYDTNSCKRKFWKLFKCKQPVNFIYRITSLASEWDLWMILW